jgi:predicted dienelactone hydrolase
MHAMIRVRRVRTVGARSRRQAHRTLVALVIAGLAGGSLASPSPAEAAGASPLPMAALAEPGPFQVASLEVQVPRTRGGQGTFAARVFVPVPGDGDGSVTGAPVLAFGHGYLADVDWYASTLEHLASWGTVVIAPRSAGGPFPDHAAFAADLLSALDWVVAAPASGGDWPGGAVDPSARAIGGHSMGGGAAILAAAADPQIRAVATLAAAETRPSAIAAAGDVRAPVLFLAAGDDGITPVEDHQRPMFEAKTTGAAQLRTIVGASHCGFLDQEPLILRLACDRGSMDPDAQRAVTRAVLTAWLGLELAGDDSLAPLAWPTTGTDGPTLVESRE